MNSSNEQIKLRLAALRDERKTAESKVVELRQELKAAREHSDKLWNEEFTLLNELEARKGEAVAFAL